MPRKESDKFMEEKIEKNVDVVESEETSAIIVNDKHELSTGLFNTDRKVRKMTSVDLSNPDNIDMVINASQNVDFKLNECINQEINCIGCLAIEREVDVVNEDTGELITRKKHTLMLFDEKGQSYVTGSNACYMSFEMICSLKGLPTPENPLVLIPIKTEAKEKGHSYLKLKLKVNKN